MSEDLIGLMREYGIGVQMLGTNESPDPASKAMFAMLAEIHNLRSRISAERQPQVSDEELETRVEELIGQHTDGTDWSFDEGMGVAVIRAVRAALGPAVPVIPEGWSLGAIMRPLELVDGIKPYIVILERASDWKRVEAMRATWHDAMTAAIAQIEKERT
jgi:hypothetical protein